MIYYNNIIHTNNVRHFLYGVSEMEFDASSEYYTAEEGIANNPSMMMKYLILYKHTEILFAYCIIDEIATNKHNMEILLILLTEPPLLRLNDIISISPHSRTHNNLNYVKMILYNSYGSISMESLLSIGSQHGHLSVIKFGLSLSAKYSDIIHAFKCAIKYKRYSVIGYLLRCYPCLTKYIHNEHILKKLQQDGFIGNI